jgi:hypothetical protein
MDEHPTEKATAHNSYTADSRFWRAGAIAATLFMSAVLAILTVDSLKAIGPGGSHVPRYAVINRHIGTSTTQINTNACRRSAGKS